MRQRRPARVPSKRTWVPCISPFISEEEIDVVKFLNSRNRRTCAVRRTCEASIQDASQSFEDKACSV